MPVIGSQRSVDIEVAEEQEQKALLRLPKDNLVRTLAVGPQLEDSETSGPILTGHFTPFNQWTKIESTFEGRFMDLRIGQRIEASPVMLPGFHCDISVVHRARLFALR